MLLVVVALAGCKPDRKAVCKASMEEFESAWKDRMNTTTDKDVKARMQTALER